MADNENISLDTSKSGVQTNAEATQINSANDAIESAAELKNLTANIVELKAIKTSLEFEISVLHNTKKLIQDSFPKFTPSASAQPTADLEEQEMDIEFVFPAVRHEGIEWTAEDIEQGLASGNREAQKVLDHLIKSKSGALKMTPKKGEDE